tara:strand:- start:27 stop:182 length:156 start_codon:yes stop_codon:yes gene_type:complete
MDSLEEPLLMESIVNGLMLRNPLSILAKKAINKTIWRYVEDILNKNREELK